MNTTHLTQRKEVTALDADVPLLHALSIRTQLPELRLFQYEADRVLARHLVGLRTG
jgi:hypothetical protein